MRFLATNGMMISNRLEVVAFLEVGGDQTIDFVSMALRTVLVAISFVVVATSVSTRQKQLTNQIHRLL